MEQKKSKPKQYGRSQSQRNNKKENGFRTTFGDKKKRVEKAVRKKGMPKWKNTVAEIEQLEKRILTETPPTGTLYYKYKPKEDELEKPGD